MKLRIALCITELRVGGAERVLVELATRLDKSQFEPLVISMQPRPDDSEPHFVDALTCAGIPVEFVDFASPMTLPIKLAKLRKIFKTFKPHVCQSFLFHANFFSRLAARSAGVPVIISGVRVAEHEKKWHLRLDRITRSLVTQYVCVSQGVADFTAKQGGIPQQKIAVIPNGVDLADNEDDGSTETRKIMTIGRLHRQKGLDWLLQTTPLWLEQRPDCELVLVGDGPERAKLQAVAAQLSCADRVRFLGHRSDVPQLLAAAELLLLPSRWEGMPNVVMQAMAAGLPVVATQVEGINELLTQQLDENDLSSPQTCRFGATDEWAAKINTLLEQPDWGRQLGKQNREHIRQYFTTEKMVESYEQLWQSLYETCEGLH